VQHIIILLTIVLFIVFSLRYHWWRLPTSYFKARVLMYHGIDKHTKDKKRNKWIVKPEDFDMQMRWLYNNGWHSFKVSELVSMTNIPKKSFVITFDDGFMDNYTNAFPVLKKYNFKATVYLVPNKTKNSWEGDRALLNNTQIQEMQNSGLVEFGSHTMSHKNLLTLISDEVVKELKDSKKEIENITKKECKTFAYPYGKLNDKIVESVKNVGYASAVIVQRGFFDKNDDIFKIKRIGILGTECFFDFYLKITRGRNKF
jgi:peptidoglycan/xylan/chitin deacetylase (PgdA/CDA1 family)